MRRGPQVGAAPRRRRVAFEDAVVGWRLWGVTRANGVTRLRSPFRDTIWPVDKPLAATCLGTHRALGSRSNAHGPPGEHCRCGVYGGTYRGLHGFLAKTFAHPAVIGRALLWGDVVEEATSWRAAYAYPDRLLVPTLCSDAYAIAEGLEAYQVPVLVLNVADTFAALNPVPYPSGTW